MDPCPDCIEHDGLCRRHERSVLPQLAQPFWYRHAHSGMYRELKEQKDHSPEALKLIRRKERRRSKRLTELKLFAITARPNAGLSFYAGVIPLHQTHEPPTSILGSQCEGSGS